MPATGLLAEPDDPQPEVVPSTPEVVPEIPPVVIPPYMPPRKEKKYINREMLENTGVVVLITGLSVAIVRGLTYLMKGGTVLALAAPIPIMADDLSGGYLPPIACHTDDRLVVQHVLEKYPRLESRFNRYTKLVDRLRFETSTGNRRDSGYVELAVLEDFLLHEDRSWLRQAARDRIEGLTSNDHGYLYALDEISSREVRNESLAPYNYQVADFILSRGAQMCHEYNLDRGDIGG